MQSLYPFHRCHSSNDKVPKRLILIHYCAESKQLPLFEGNHYLKHLASVMLSPFRCISAYIATEVQQYRTHWQTFLVSRELKEGNISRWPPSVHTQMALPDPQTKMVYTASDQ